MSQTSVRQLMAAAGHQTAGDFTGPSSYLGGCSARREAADTAATGEVFAEVRFDSAKIACPTPRIRAPNETFAAQYVEARHQ